VLPDEPVPLGVIACVEQLATDAGAQMLRSGGNATDAALATAFAQCVVNPVHAGVAGSFHGLFWNAGSGSATVVSAGGRAPRAARPGPASDWIIGYRASTVPGFIRGAAEAHRRFGSGRIGWADLIGPAIRLASDGFEVYPYLHRLWAPTTEYGHGFLEGEGPEILGLTEPSRRIYLHPDGSVYETGERLVQDDYARTLGRIAEQGPDEFYRGQTAQAMTDDFARSGGLLSAMDLADFEADVSDPITTTFRDFEVLTEPGPSVGPVILEALNILEGWDLAELGWNEPPYLDCLARALHLAFRDRVTQLGDPDFVEVPIERLISKEYAARLRVAIEDGSDVAEPAGSVGPEGTTHVSVIDATRNCAAITHSIGSASGVVTPGLGFMHNSHMSMFDPTPDARNGVEPWKRPITGGGPALFLRDGAPYLLIGSPAGGRKVSAIVQAFLNHVAFGMSLADAVAVDRIHADAEPRTIIVEPHFAADTLRALARLGHHIRFEWYTARLAAVADLPAVGLVGASDPRGDGGLQVVS
jgi:gamma-glutamyltranspeptidase/glutathione hydrolase